jgi:hypothetical protein
MDKLSKMLSLSLLSISGNSETPSLPAAEFANSSSGGCCAKRSKFNG